MTTAETQPETLPPLFLDGIAPFALEPLEKASYLRKQLEALWEHHRARCPGYSRLVDNWQRYRGAEDDWLIGYPFLPVSAFKEFDLRSTEDAVATVRSSATTSHRASSIAVDKPTRKRQSLSANKILADFVGPEKRPYLVFDTEATVRGTESLSARGAAILSLAHLAEKFYFLMQEVDGELQLDREALSEACREVGDRPFLAYGFTYILYQAHQMLAANALISRPAHPDSRLLHSGGWKRLINLAVDKPTFNRTIAAPWGLPPQNVIDFYGTVEQVGMLYPDCSEGVKHVPYWADVILRRADTLAPVEVGETGLIQLLSCLPLSAPNQSVLTEDLGRLVRWDECACVRRGKAFVFEGRAPRSELRGCSDVARF